MEKCKRTSSKKSSKQSPTEHRTRIDPSFKSKRYRDKLRYEIKSLESFIPVDRTSLNRKLDSQTVFRLVLAYFRTKQFFRASKLEKEFEDEKSPDDKQILQSLDGFILLLSSDGTILFISENVLQYIGFNQVDLLHRCIYGIVHPEDHNDLKVALEQTLSPLLVPDFPGITGAMDNTDICKPLSFICRMKYFNGSSAGYLKMHCSGKILHHPDLVANCRSSNQIVFLFVHPFMYNRLELLCSESKEKTFWSKHELDLKIREMDEKCKDVLGFNASEFQNISFYSLIHPEDLSIFAACHKLLTESTDVQTVYFRLETKDQRWKWFQSRGKVLSKNSKKFSIVFSHCPLSEEDSTFIQQETVIRQKYSINDLYRKLSSGEFKRSWNIGDTDNLYYSEHKDRISAALSCSQSDDLLLSLQSSNCPSTWHMLSDRHSPVLPSNHVAHKLMQQEKQRQYLEYRKSQQTESMLVCNNENNGMEHNLQRQQNIYYSNLPYQPYLGLPEMTSFRPRFQYHPNISASVMSSAVVLIPNHPNVYHQAPSSGFYINSGGSDIYNISTNIQTNLILQSSNDSVYHSNYDASEANIHHYRTGDYTKLQPRYVNSQSLNPTWIGQCGNVCDTSDVDPKTPTPSRIPTSPEVLVPSCGGVSESSTRTESAEMNESVHMKIVDNTPVQESPRQVDLPSIGSFLEYLNEV